MNIDNTSTVNTTVNIISSTTSTNITSFNSSQLLIKLASSRRDARCFIYHALLKD